MMNKRTLIIRGLIILGLILLVTIIYLLIPKTYIKFETAPHQVSVLVDNKNEYSIINGKSIKVSPGKHTVQVSQNEFGTYTKSIEVEKGKTFDFLVVLTPFTDNAKSKLQNSESQAVIEHFYDNIYVKETDIITKNYPILEILPIQARLYRISACPSKKYPNDATKIALCVDETQSDLQPYVLKDIKSRGYNPDDYEIIWIVNKPRG